MTALPLAAALVLAQTAPPTFSTDVSSVFVDVFVEDETGPVVGLSAADFTLTDNRVPQQVRLVAADSVPLNVLFAFDTSSSVRGASSRTSGTQRARSWPVSGRAIGPPC